MSTYTWSYAPTNRATCKGKCKEKIEKGAVRFGVSSDDSYMHHSMTSFRCLNCVTDIQVKNVIAKCGSLEECEGYDDLNEDDQAMVSALAGGVAAAAKAKAKGKAKAKVAAAKPKARVAPKPKAKAAARVPAEKLQHAFCDAAKDYKLDKVKEMLEAEPGLIDVQPCGRWSALHQFAAKGDEEAVVFLLEKGASKLLTNKDGKTPVEVADAKVIAYFDDPLEEEEVAEEEEPVEEEKEAAASSGAKRKAPEVAAPTPTKAVAVPAAVAPSPKKAKGAGGRPVDTAVPNRDKYTVVDDWSVLLNQTNVGMNNNKFYKIQLLKHENGSFACFTHWGRVGAAGQNQLQPFGNQGQAESAFKSKFKAKSGVPYELLATHDWAPTVGKYTYVQTEEGDGEDGDHSAPLGKLSPAQIEKGQAVLAKLGDVLGRGGKKDVTKINAFSSEFYTLIPHNFGFSVPPAINTTEMLEAEEELLKFYMRMGFEEMDQADEAISPVDGIMALPLPPTLEEAASKVCAMTHIKASNAKGKQHEGKQSGGPAKKMSAALYAAIMLYTSNAIYKDLNACLRSEDRVKIKKYFQYLRMLLEALGSFEQTPRTVWRGIGVDLFDQYAVGQTITWWGVSSCTADIKVAEAFMNGCGGKCSLLTVKTKTAADISKITFFANEKENLLAPGTQLKVLSSKREGKISKIELEEVGRQLQ